MALIQCPKCNQNISDQAVKCIHCGEIILENTCKECGNQFPADLHECPNCGLPVSAKTEKRTYTANNNEESEKLNNAPRRCGFIHRSK